MKKSVGINDLSGNCFTSSRFKGKLMKDVAFIKPNRRPLQEKKPKVIWFIGQLGHPPPARRIVERNSQIIASHPKD
jgi:hypothetical protein